jgi:hypothetical protein
MFIEISMRLSQAPEERHMVDAAPPELGELLRNVFYKHYAPLALQNQGICLQYQDSRRSKRFAIWVAAIAVFNEISQARHRDGRRRVKGAEIAECPPRGLTASGWLLCQIWIRKRRSE